MHDYASLGVPEAWIISPEARTVEIRQLTNGILEQIAIVADGDLQPSQFPDVSIPINAEFWPELR